MRSNRLAFGLLWLLAGCAPSPESHSKAFLGALLIDGAGGPPVSNSIVLTAGDRITAAGPRSAIAIPAEADRIDGSGKCLAPAPLDVWDRAEPVGIVNGPGAEDARRQVGEAVGRGASVIYLARVAPDTAEAALDAARGAQRPLLASIATIAEARFLVDHGASALVGVPTDTEDLDATWLERVRTLRVAVAPALVSSGASLETAKRNTRRIFDSGAPIATATRGGDLQREIELLSEAGLPPLDALVAATRNAAAMLGRSDTGTIAPGKRADLLLLSANPGEDVRNLRRVSLRLSGGEWGATSR